jgi:RNA polymerase sigma-70 factor (ECF subfamily)
MMPKKDRLEEENSHDISFRTTRWPIVWGANSSDSVEASHFLELLCRQYWKPLFAFVRCRGHSEHDAQDLTQAFFAKLLEKEWLKVADPTRGRFRTFLLTAFKRFLANEREYSLAKKRGGGVQTFPIDPGGEIQIADPRGHTAESMFERQWAMTVLQTAMKRLRSEYHDAGRLEDFERLKSCLTAERGSIDYSALASQLKVRPVSARCSVHRIRAKFREFFREEVADTVADPDEIDDEMKALFRALSVDSIASGSTEACDLTETDT